MAFRDNKNKKDEDDGYINPFEGLEKSSVLQEARAFNEMPINPRKCIFILTKILYLIYQGETIATTEATETFFAMTKLFQNKDPTLRRMVYLAIKEMANIAEDVIIVTSSLTKDMTGKEMTYRASAIRTLCRITDSTMMQGIERYLKQAIVDKHPAVASAALVSSLHLMKDNHDVVKRWVNEVQRAVDSSQMVQYHALGLLYHIKKKDRLAITKLVTKFTQGHNVRSMHAHCILIRYIAKVLDEESEHEDKLLKFLEDSLRNKSEIVIYEAARAIVNLKSVSPRELNAAVSVLQLFLSSPKPTLRFAGVRTLNQVAISHPNALKTCNLDMENLITDSNRSIATLAITTLLKTGNESSVDRLMKQISSFMSEISDEFKIVVIDAVRVLCLKFQDKHVTMMNFLADALHDRGGFTYKRAIVDTIVAIVDNVDKARESGLACLCEFIEDCEYPSLLTRVLYILGQQGPLMPQPSKYIRFIYNRLILEDSKVRAAAVSALAKFGAHCESLSNSISVLLRRCLYDGDDEVRDRATFYLSLLEKNAVDPEALDAAKTFILKSPNVSLADLEMNLGEYLGNEETDTAFDISIVPEAKEEIVAPTMGMLDDGSAAAAASKTTASAEQKAVFEKEMAEIPGLAALNLGSLFKSNKPVPLTEPEADYVAVCIKHVYEHHVVFQFDITNRMNDQLLEDVHIVLEGGEQEVDEDEIISVPCNELVFEKPGTSYVCLPLDPTIAAQTFSAKMDFQVKDCDPETGEADEASYPDSYELEDFDFNLADFVRGEKLPFSDNWQKLEDAHDSGEQTFALSMDGLEDAVSKIQSFLGLSACEGSNRVNPDKSSHTLLLAGEFVGGHKVLAKARLAYDQEVTLSLCVRSTDENACSIIASAVG